MTSRTRSPMLAGLLVCLSFHSAPAQNTPTTSAGEQHVPAGNMIAVIRLDGQITESPPMLDVGLGELPTRTLRNWAKRIRRSATDQNVSAMVILIDQPIMGWAQMQDLRRAIGQVRRSGKKVYCHALSLGASEYLLACAADQIALAPGGELSLVGLAAQVLYLKDLMDKIGLRADLEHIGPYKLAGEPFTAAGPSRFMDEQMNGLLDGLYEDMIRTIAEARKLTVQQVRRIIDAGPYLDQAALRAGLIDSAQPRRQYLTQLAEDLSARLIVDYAKTRPPETEPGFMGLIKLLGSLAGRTTPDSKPTIALVYIEGYIALGASEEGFGTRVAGARSINAALHKAMKDENIKAVVVRIDSPGGSATAAEAMWQELHLLSQSKPTVASMGNLAASGGYYVACAADHIYAQPGTITGSIGIVGGKLVVGDLLEKIGVTVATYHRGQNATLGRIDQPFDEKQRQLIRSLLAEEYELFKQRVRTGRSGKLTKELDQMAGGRIYTGSQAVELGLVDQLGSLLDAIEFAASTAGIKDYKIQVMPKPKTLFDLILESLGYDTDSIAASRQLEGLGLAWLARRVRPATARWTGPPQMLLGLNLGDLPLKVADLMLLADELARGSALAVMPYTIRIR